MKKLGLIGGIGPESTIIYYREILHNVYNKTRNFPNVAIESLSCFDVFKFCDNGDFVGLSEYVSNGIKNLANAGADFVALCGNTPNVVMDELIKNSPVPIISSIECSANFALQNGLKRLILLGTRTTMRADFFQKVFAKKDIEIFVPNDDEIEFIADKIATEIELGIVKKQTQDEIVNIINRLKLANNADGVILGCTELPILFEGYKFDIASLDTMRIHIKALSDMILKG